MAEGTEKAQSLPALSLGLRLHAATENIEILRNGDFLPSNIMQVKFNTQSISFK